MISELVLFEKNIEFLSINFVVFGKFINFATLDNKLREMKRFFRFIFTGFILSMSGVSVAAVYDMPVGNLVDLSHCKSQKVRKADAKKSIEGVWRFQLGDYYFDDSTMETIEYDLTATFYGDILFFEEADESILPMAAMMDQEGTTLNFVMGKLGDFYGYGNLVLVPSLYDAVNEKFTASNFSAVYDAPKGIIEFPENTAMQWWVFDYYDNPMFSIDAYTFVGPARKVSSGKTPPTKLIINKDKGNEVSVDFKDFSKIYFKDGKVIFDNENGLSFPLIDLRTMHFEAEEQTLSISSPVDDNVRFEYGNGWIKVTGLPEGATLDIYAINGAKTLSVKAYTGEEIDISNLAAGIYIVNSGKHSFKIIK